jgi:hypothetical protein
MSTPNAEPTTEMSLEPAVEIAQPTGPPVSLPQSFKCEKCGAAFADEGAAAVHIQTCKGLEEPATKDNEEKEGKQKPIPEQSSTVTPPPIA